MKIAEHYDLLIANGNDPMLDSEELKNYMDKWDGNLFVSEMNPDKCLNVLEIGCGTGRMAAKIAGEYKSYTGIDLSSASIKRAEEHFAKYDNMNFICGDFLEYSFRSRFDVIFSTLVFMHIKDKLSAYKKIYGLLPLKGKFVLSIDKNQAPYIDTGYSRIDVYPDNPEKTECLLRGAGFKSLSRRETEFAFIFTALKEFDE